MATIRLPVHPLYGEQVEVIESHGRYGLRVEQPDGQLRLIPVSWTDRAPRPAARVVHGRPVRLAPEALRELVAWVGARIPRKSRERLDVGAGEARQLEHDAVPPEGAAVPQHSGGASPLVGQVGPPGVGRRGVRQKRGHR
jgi:hypothetical protein